MNQPADPSRTHSQPGVTGQHRRDEALILALDATLTSIWDYDLSTGQVTLDANWSRMRGGPAMPIVTGIKELLALLHPEDRLRAWRASLNCVTGRAPEYSQKYRVLDEQGEWLWVHCRGRAAERDANGRATRMIGTNIDITQRKPTALATSREIEFLTALNQTTTALLQHRAKGELLSELASRAGRLLGDAEVEIVLTEEGESGPSTNPSTFSTGKQPGWQKTAEFRQAMERGEPVSVPAGQENPGRNEGPDTSEAPVAVMFPILLNGQCRGVLAFRWPRGRRALDDESSAKGRLLAQLVALIIHNTTLGEDALRAAEANTTALRESEQLYRSLVESVRQGYYIANRRSLFTYCNPAMHAMGGFAPGELVGQSSFRLVAEEDRERVMATYRRWVQDRNISHATCEFRVVTKNGRQFWVEQNTDFIRDPNGRVVEGRNMLLDISERKEAESALRQSEAKLRQAQKLESLGTLAGGIAHDFNNILTGILGFAHLCQTDLAPDHPAAHWIDGILKSGERAKGLVQQILTFSRKTESMRGPVHLQLVTRESVALLRSTLPAMVRLESEIDPACPPVMADPTEIHQVILNLCTNAWHALPETGGCIEVRLLPCEVDERFAVEHGPLQPGPHVRLSVRDNGKGMSAAIIERIFEPFFTTKEAGKGTGLGLAVVHSIVQSHEGAIHLQSAPGQGTTFELYFPALPTPTNPEESATAPAELPRGQGQSVLVVDDEPMSGTVISRLAEKFGYRVTYCSDPLQAIALFYANDFDLLVTDLAMPGLPGDELARQVIARKPGMPVLLLSGFIEPAKLDQLRQIGVREILNKPPSAEDLISALHRCLQP